MRTVVLSTLALYVLTALGALVGVLAPSLAPTTQPRPTLHPGVHAIAAILATNLRVLAAPFIFTISRFGTSRHARAFGDAAIATILAGNAVHIGLALGRWQGQLLPFIPQLPLEYLAAGAAAATWLDARRTPHRERPHRTRTTASYAGLSLLLLTTAASLEVLLTPHAA